MVMFGAIIYVPVFAQGVLGVDATASGLILMPMMLGLIVFGILTGFLITKTGRYKEFILFGAAVLTARPLDVDPPRGDLRSGSSRPPSP